MTGNRRLRESPDSPRPPGLRGHVHHLQPISWGRWCRRPRRGLWAPLLGGRQPPCRKVGPTRRQTLSLDVLGQGPEEAHGGSDGAPGRGRGRGQGRVSLGAPSHPSRGWQCGLQPPERASGGPDGARRHCSVGRTDGSPGAWPLSPAGARLGPGSPRPSAGSLGLPGRGSQALLCTVT